MLLQELFVRIGAQTNAAQFAAAKRSIDGLKVGIAALSAIGGIVAYRLGSITKEMTSMAKGIQVTSQMAGIGVESLQELQYAAKQTGSDAGSLTIGLRFLARNMQAVADGSKKHVATFASLGVKVKDASGKMRPLDEVMLDIAERFKAMPDGANKATLAVKLFGLTMVPMLNQGREGIQALRDELRQVGGVMSSDTVEAGARLEDTIDKMNAAVTGLRISLFSMFAPKLTDLIDKKIVPAITKFRAWEERTHGVEKALKVLGYTLGGVAAAVALFSFGKAIFAIGEVVTMMKALGNAAVVSQIKMLAIPILVGAAFAAFLLIVQDIYYFMKGYDSLLGDIINKNPQLKVIGDTFRAIGAYAAYAAKYVEYLWAAITGSEEERRAIEKEADLFRQYAETGVFGSKENLGGTETESKVFELEAKRKVLKRGLENLRKASNAAVFETVTGVPLMPTNAYDRARFNEWLLKNNPLPKNLQPPPSPVINAPITINAAPGMSEEELANKVKEKITETFSEMDAQLSPAQ